MPRSSTRAVASSSRILRPGCAPRSVALVQPWRPERSQAATSSFIACGLSKCSLPRQTRSLRRSEWHRRHSIYNVGDDLYRLATVDSHSKAVAVAIAASKLGRYSTSSSASLPHSGPYNDKTLLSSLLLASVPTVSWQAIGLPKTEKKNVFSFQTIHTA